MRAGGAERSTGAREIPDVAHFGGAAVNRDDEERGAGERGIGGRLERCEPLRDRRARVRHADLRARYLRQHLVDPQPRRTGVLEQLGAVRGPGDVAADDEHRDPFEVRGGDPGDGVGGPRPRGDNDGGDLAARPMVPHGSERGGRLVARLDQARPLMAEDGVEDWRHGAAGNAKERVNPRFDEGEDEERRCRRLARPFADVERRAYGRVRYQRCSGPRRELANVGMRPLFNPRTRVSFRKLTSFVGCHRTLLVTGRPPRLLRLTRRALARA